MVDWDDPTADQRCVLLHAVEEDYLSRASPEGIRQPMTALAPTEAGLAIYAPSPDAPGDRTG